MILKFYSSVEKMLKVIFRKFWGIIPMFEEIAGEMLLGEVFLDLNLFPCYPYASRFKERDITVHEQWSSNRKASK